MYRQRKEDKKPPDVELATLSQIRGNIESNAIYASTDNSTLPKIRREQIVLTKFLGSGAFGEVTRFILSAFNILIIDIY